MTRKTSTYAPIAALAVALLTSAPALAANTVKPAPAPGPSEKEGCEGTINYCGWQALEYATVSGVPVYYYVNGVTMQDGIGGQDSLGYATWTDILQVGPGSNTNNGNPVSLAMSAPPPLRLLSVLIQKYQRSWVSVGQPWSWQACQILG